MPSRYRKLKQHNSSVRFWSAALLRRFPCGGRWHIPRPIGKPHACGQLGDRHPASLSKNLHRTLPLPKAGRQPRTPRRSRACHAGEGWRLRMPSRCRQPKQHNSSARFLECCAAAPLSLWWPMVHPASDWEASRLRITWRPSPGLIVRNIHCDLPLPKAGRQPRTPRRSRV